MLKTTLLLGDDALSIINAPVFLENWKKLSAFTPGFTLLQEPEFVATWYAIYKDVYDPVISVLLKEENTPLGLMCLAWDEESQTLTHAGHKDAEYHGWLAMPEFETKFLNETTALIRQQIAIKSWDWGWMPPGLSSTPLNKIKIPGSFIQVEQGESLIWDLSNLEKLQKLRKNRSLKSKTKRLQKRGELHFREITCATELTELLSEVRYQNDFRREALNDIRPFEDDPNKIPFLVSLLNYPGIIHVSGLFLDDKLLAFHLGIASKKRVCLGVSSFDPSESKFSPGNLLMVDLASTLTEQGYEIFDLTPGKNPYKERFANQKQKIYRPSFYFSYPSYISARFKRVLVDLLKRVLRIGGPNIHSIKNGVDKFNELVKKVSHHGILNALLFLFKGIYHVKNVRLYRVDKFSKDLKTPKKVTVNFQHYQDLMSYRDKSSWQTRRDMLKDAISRFGHGESLLSSTKDKELCWLCWHTYSQGFFTIRGFSKKIELPGDAHVLTDFYCNDLRSFSDYLEESIVNINQKKIPVFLLMDRTKPDNKEKLGEWNNSLVKELVCVQIFWRIKFIREKEIS